MVKIYIMGKHIKITLCFSSENNLIDTQVPVPEPKPLDLHESPINLCQIDSNNNQKNDYIDLLNKENYCFLKTKKILKEMTIEEKVGQMFLVRYPTGKNVLEEIKRNILDENDISLKGEFIRNVLSSNMPEEDKIKIIE